MHDLWPCDDKKLVQKPTTFVSCEQLPCAGFTVNYTTLSTTGLLLRPVSWSQLFFVTLKKYGSATNEDVAVGDILQTLADVGPIYQLKKQKTKHDCGTVV